MKSSISSSRPLSMPDCTVSRSIAILAIHDTWATASLSYAGRTDLESILPRVQTLKDKSSI